MYRIRTRRLDWARRPACAALLLAVCCGAVRAAEGEAPPEEEARAILERVRRVYRSAPTYRAEGETVTHLIDLRKGEETRLALQFEMELGRPDLYRITWTQDLAPLPTQRGAVWNAGNGPRLYLSGPNQVTEVRSDRMALAGATGPSMGTSHFIPSLFFNMGPGTDPTERLTDLAVETTQEIDGRPCHVLRGRLSASVTYRLWISKESYEILRIENATSGGPQEEKVPTMTPEEEAEALRAIGSEVNEETRAALRGALSRARERLDHLEGKTTQHHRGIVMHRAMEPDAYVFEPPADAEVVSGPSAAPSPPDGAPEP